MKTTGILWYLFGTDGRTSRLSYWLSGIATTVMYLLGNLVLESLGDDSSPTSVVILLGLLVWFAVLIWMGVAISVKRWHDRDKAGYWILINFIPLVGSIWSFIELGLLRGTDGPNRYGDQPDMRGYERPKAQLSGQH